MQGTAAGPARSRASLATVHAPVAAAAGVKGAGSRGGPGGEDRPLLTAGEKCPEWAMGGVPGREHCTADPGCGGGDGETGDGWVDGQREMDGVLNE